MPESRLNEAPAIKPFPVLVTGGAGYIGSHTVRELLKKGYQVLVVDNLSRGHRASVTGALVEAGDILNKKMLGHIMREHEIRAVVHFAASSLVGESMQEPAAYYRNNLLGGLSLLDTMVEERVPYLVFSSTAAVYGETETMPLKEEQPTEPSNPYGSTKLALERAIRWYGEAYGLKYITLRYFNAAGADPAGDIGEDHTPETHLIPLVIKVALGQLPCVSIFGKDYPTPDGTCVRDYIHVSDLARAHLLALEALAAGADSNIYNLGNGSGYSVLEVIRAVETVAGKKVKVEFTERRPGDPAILIASCEKARRELGWRPYYTGLPAIIESAWRWHSCRPAGFKE